MPRPSDAPATEASREPTSTITRFSVAEYDRMIEAGVFRDRQDQRGRLELIYGEIREMAPPGPLHESAVDWLTEWSIHNVDRQQVRVRIQNSVGIPELDSVPLPDVVWVRRQSYRERRPEICDVLLVIKVSDSTLRGDRGEKLGLYARAGVGEYWIVNVRDQCVEVYRNPTDGGYAWQQRFSGGQQLSPLAQAQVTLDVTELMRA